MAYNRNIPAATDLISNSQSAIQGNFQAIDSGQTGNPGAIGFSRNHVTMTDATNGGLHHRVDYYQNVAAPTIGAFVSSLYPREFPAASSISQLFFKNGVSEYQLTNLGRVTTTPSASGYGLTTPWGIVINWGQIAVGAGGPTSGTSLTFQVPFPTSVDSIIATGINSNGSQGNVTVTGGSTTGCTLFSANNNTVYFFAIGH